MNIFVTNIDPVIAAQDLDNKRVVKMILESTQLLCTALNYCGYNAPYKSTHVNHPCSIWVRNGSNNFKWLFKYTLKLLDIYQSEYYKIHKCYTVIEEIEGMIDNPNLHIMDIVSIFPNCTVNKDKNISFKHIKDPVEAYRNYLIARWNTDTRLVTWGRREQPCWAIRDLKGLFIPYSETIKILYEKE